MTSSANRLPSDRTELLLADVVALPDADQAAALAAICAEHPDLAAALRSRYALFARMAATPAPARDGASDGAEPRRFGDYTLLRELGRGGMGVVHLASQRRGDQERLIALKLVRDRFALSPAARERLRREGAAAFQLDHPGICRAYDLGEIDGTPFVSMRYVPGRTLAALLAEAREAGRPLELSADDPESGSSTATGSTVGGSRIRGLLLLAEHVARALHAAHEAGFVHRDVKPGNIMVGTDGMPVLLDFGLVLDERSAHGLTLTDQPLGTPTYMAPEQIAPRGRRVDRTADVWSLGATLYELLAGQPPFHGANREQLFRQILDEPPPRLHGRVAGVSRDLEVVLRTALDKDPARRYRTAQALAEDLRRVRLAQPIAAVPPGTLRRVWLWSRRNPVAAVMLGLLAASQVVIVVLAVRAERRATEAQEQRELAETGYREASEAIDELTEVARIHLSDVPWMEPVRRTLFDQVLAFHERTMARGAEIPDPHRAAPARVQAAHLLLDLGRTADAQALAEAAVASFVGRTDGIAHRWSASARRVLANTARFRGDVAGAEAHFRAAIAHFDALGIDAGSAVIDRHERARCHFALAELLEPQAARTDECRRELERTLELCAAHGSKQLQVDHASALRLRARIARVGDASGEALADLQASCAILRTLVAADPHDRQARSHLATSLLALGLVQRQRRDAEAAAAAYGEARTVLEGLTSAFPYVLSYCVNLAHVHNNLSVLLRNAGDEPGARAAIEQSIARTEDALRIQPDHFEALHLLASGRLNLANQIRQEDPARAVRLYDDALALADRLLTANPGDRRVLDLGCRIANSLGAAHARAQRFEPALAAFTKAQQWTERLLAEHGRGRPALRNAAMLHHNVGTLACELGDFERAETALRSAVALDEEITGKTPQDPDALVLLLSHRLRLATVVALRDAGAAEPLWQAAATALDPLPTEARTRVQRDPATRFDLFCALRGLAECRLRAGDVGGADQLLREAAGLADPGTSVAVHAEALLLAKDRLRLAALRGDATGAARAAGELVAAADAVAPRLVESPLHRRRIASALPEIEELLLPHGDPTHRAALAALQAAARP